MIRIKNMLMVPIIGLMVLCMGCEKGVRYQMTAPEGQVVNVEGLDPDDKIVEVFDNYNGAIAQDKWMWMVIKRGKEYKIGKINLINGQVSEIQPLATYDPNKPFYWTHLSETKMGGGEACMQTCLASTPCGGTTEKWGFEAEKQFWGDPNHSVGISYQYLVKGRSTGDAIIQEWQKGARQRFVKGEQIVDIATTHGYSDTFALKTYPKARYYPLFDSIYIGFQPNSLKNVEIVDLFIYDINTKESWGADLDFEKGSYYVDGAITPDYSTVCLIVGTPGKYRIWQYEPKKTLRAVKMFKTVQ